MTSGQVVGYGASDVSFTSSPPLAAAAAAAVSPFSLPLPPHAGVSGMLRGIYVTFTFVYSFCLLFFLLHSKNVFVRTVLSN